MRLSISKESSVADTVESHEKSFEYMLLLIKKATVLVSEAIQELPPILILTANKIDAYINKIQHNDGDGESESDSTPSIGAKTLRLRR